MSGQIFLDDIKLLTVSELKSVVAEHKWRAAGARLKADFQKLIVQSSYNDMQIAGVAVLDNLVKQ